MHFLSVLQKLLIPILFITFYVFEPLYAARRIPKNRTKHFIDNLKLVFINLLILSIGASFIISLARGCEDIQFGLLHFIPHGKNNIIFALIGIFLYDLVNYGVHRLYHTVDFFWTIHRVYHADTYIDVSTGFRLHPLESIFRVAIQTTAVGLLGIPPLSLALYGVVAVTCILWSHSNIEKVNQKWWHYLEKLVVMPDVQRVHHSALRKHHDNNYGIAFVIWDRLFGTYLSPKEVTGNFEIGLKGYDDNLGFVELIKDPMMPPKHTG
ncbi:MAG: sterol desaturase family protein [Xanthomonadaceae bacterium]|nr:sterol desaturase family protein [Xanthomonadaceae bacterium]